MDIVLIEASDAELKEASRLLGPDVTVHAASAQEVQADSPVTVLFLRHAQDPSKLIAAQRARFGQLTLLVGVGSSDISIEQLIEAGLDELVESVDALAKRFPFLLARLQQRARRHLRLEAILENTVDGILVIDSKGVVQSVNRAVKNIFGYDQSEVLGQNVSMLMPSPDRERHDGYLANYLRSGEAKIIGIGREVSGRRKDGTTFPLDLAVSEVRLDGHILFAGIIRDISDRRRLETEVLRISEEERRRIGRDMHDGLGQMLTGIGLIANNVAKQLAREGAPGADDVAEIADLVREADEQARALSRGLVMVELDRDGLSAALKHLCGQAERLFGGKCTLELVGEPGLREGSTAVNLYRIAQEAVSNAFKHGRAENVNVVFGRMGDQLRLSVQDDGIGFEYARKSSGMGVQIMNYRVSILGGRLEISSPESGGSLVSCDIPLPGPDDY